MLQAFSSPRKQSAMCLVGSPPHPLFFLSRRRVIVGGMRIHPGAQLEVVHHKNRIETFAADVAQTHCAYLLAARRRHGNKLVRDLQRRRASEYSML